MNMKNIVACALMIYSGVAHSMNLQDTPQGRAFIGKIATLMRKSVEQPKKKITSESMDENVVGPVSFDRVARAISIATTLFRHDYAMHHFVAVNDIRGFDPGVDEVHKTVSLKVVTNKKYNAAQLAEYKKVTSDYNLRSKKRKLESDEQK